MTNSCAVLRRHFVSFAAALLLLVLTQPLAAAVWINEIHYDNSGADTQEGVEIAGTAGTDLTGWTIVPYNGNVPTAAVPYTPIGTLSGTIPNQSNGFGTVYVAIAGLQNGPSDGLALVNNGVVVQFLSYEGVITAAAAPGGGVAAGMTSTDIGVSQAGTQSDAFTLQLQGTGNQYSDFTWAAGVAATRGTINTGQTFTAVGPPPPPNLTINDVSQAEAANGGIMTFTVSLSAPAGAGGVTFDYATNATGSATSPSDFTAIGTTAGSIPAGSSTATINVTIVDDGVQETNETFEVVISNVVGATAVDTTGVGTIVNDDGPPTISVADVSQAENSSPTMTFVVQLSAPAGPSGVTFTISTSAGTATAGTDYTETTATPTIAAGQQTYNFVVPIGQDTTFEGNETFNVTISGVTGADPGDLTAVGTITNDDAQPNLTINDPFVIEGAAGTQEMVFTVSLNNASSLNTTFDYATSNSSATAGVDYIAETGSGSIPAGSTSTTISITINGDTTVEGNEDFLVTLTNVVNANAADTVGIGVIMLDEPISIAAANTPYTENFNTLGSTGTQAGTTPAGWTLDETGAAANGLYTISNGTGTSGDTYSLGATGDPDRAFGTLASNALQSTVGGFFANNTGTTITTLSIAYTGEQWRLGQADANTDRLDFAYSTNATALDDGAATWTEVNALDFVSPINSGSVGNRDGNLAVNRTAVGFTISGLSIPNGGTFWLRWVDPNIGGSDDALGIDDFSIIANIAGGVLTSNDVVVTEGDGAGTVNAVFTVTLSQAAGPGGVSFDIATANGTATAGVDYVANSITGAVIPEGQTTYQFTVVVNSDDTEEPSETFFVNVTNVGGATLSDGQGLGTIASDDFTFTRIHTIQGSGLQSPLAGSTVTIEGIITGIKTGGSGGFFVQEQVTDYDADVNTSEGIFVFTGGANPPAVVIGNLVAVTGTVTEFPNSATPHTVTELSGTITVDLLSAETQPLPAATVITTADGAPSTNLSQYERFEGMRVSTTLTVVAPTDGSIDENDAIATSNGVFYGVVAGNPRPFREPGIEQTYTIPPEATCAACIDRFDENPEKIRVDSDNQPGATQLNVVAGQTVSNLVGVLDYGFFEYTLLPEAATVPIVTGDSTADPVPTPLATELTVSGFNMFHFFDDDDDPGVSDIELTTVAYQNRLQKASLAIRNILQTPDVIGVVEVDNITTLQDLAARINADTLGVTNYFAYLEEGNDVGGIDVGFLVDLNRVTVQAVTQIGKDTTWINPHTGLQDASPLNDRPSLVLEASILRPDATVYEFVVIVNHLRSLIGIEENTAAGRRVRAKRAAQAEFLAAYVQSRQVADPTERIILVGDFNAFEFNDGFVDVMGTIKGTPAPATEVVEPTDDLVNPNLTNLIETLPADQRYTYVFDGNAQAIDHALVNAAMLPSVSRFVVAHLDADYPNIYYSDFTRPERLADHDATLAYFDLTPLPRISIGDTSATEGNAGTTVMTFTVSLSAPSTSTVTVNYTTSNGSATAGSDYTAESGTVTFVPGDVSETITIDVTGELLFEGDETLFVTLSSPSITAMINDGTATGTILNDDAPSGMFITDSSVNEDAGTITFTVQLATPVPSTVTVDYTTIPGTATAGADYTTTSGTLTFLANDQSETIVVPLVVDALAEPNETFTVVLSNASATTTISDGTALGTILNDDAPVAINIADSAGNEDAGTITFTVTLASPVASTVTVDFVTTDGTAIAGVDYVTRSGTLTFAPNDQSETFTVTLLADTAFEGNETFTVTLSNPSSTTIIADGTATGTILNDDTPSGMFITDSSINEDAGTITFTVQLASPVPSTVTVDYTTVAGTATAGADYTTTSGTLTFLANDQSETIVVPLVVDALAEPDETFTVVLSNVTPTATISDGTAVGTILNDDASVADLTLTKTAAPANPGPGNNVTYTVVVRNNGPQTATGVVVTDDMPNGMLLISSQSTQGTCTGTDPIQCTIGTLAMNQSATITIVAQLPANAGGAFVNNATADSNESDPTPPTASATITLPSHGEAQIPTLSEWMLIMLAGLLALFAAMKLRT